MLAGEDSLFLITAKGKGFYHQLISQHQILGNGNFVLAVSEGTFGDAPTSYYDLFRVENGKIAEHWDVMETIISESDRANSNGKF